MKSEPGPPMTLGNAAKAELRLIVWCRGCGLQVEPHPAQLAERYGARHADPRLARAARLLQVRRTRCRFCRERDFSGLIGSRTRRRLGSHPYDAMLAPCVAASVSPAAAVLTLLGTGFLPILGWKFEWVTAHWIAGLVLAALVALHIVRASFWLDFWSMVVGFDDVRSGWRAVGQAFGRKGPPPLKPGKYSLLQKLYHLAVAGVVLALVATGLLMLLKIDTPLWRRNPYWFSDQAWGVIYAIHDLCAMSVITLLMAHVYFALRPEKLWMSRSMIRGWISNTDYRTHHDPARWPRQQGGQ